MEETIQEQEVVVKPHEQESFLIPEVTTISKDTIENGNEYEGGDEDTSYILNVNFDLNRSGEEWLSIISNKMKLTGEYWNDWTSINQMRRAIKKLSNLAKVSKVTWGYGIKGVKGRTAIWRESSDTINVKGLYTHQDTGICYDKNITKDLWEDDYPTQTDKLDDYEKNEVLKVDISKDHICQTCKGQKLMRCPNCEGSGREQYVDGYFASGEERIKTGTCHECYGKGQITCPDCDGTGLEGGTGIISKIQLYKEHYISLPNGFTLTPWFLRDHIDGRFFEEDSLLKYKNKKTLIYDKRDEIESGILSKIGFKYSPLIKYLYDSINVTKENLNIVELFLRIDQIVRVICLEYYFGDKHCVFYIFETNDNKCIVNWNRWCFPTISLFGKVRYWGEYDE